MITNPHMLPKVRSRMLLDAIGGKLNGQSEPFPCSVRLSPMMGRPCSSWDTVVGAHLPTIGKGISTKVSDLFVVAACDSCHRIMDGVGNKEAWFSHQYPGAFFEALLLGHHETLARWVDMGLIEGRDWEIVR